MFPFFISRAAGRTTLDFAFTGSIWPEVEAWAKEAGFRLHESDAARRRYYKGSLLHVPVWLDIRQQGSDVHLEAWVKSQAAPMSIASYLIPDEMVLESGGLVGIGPRASGRKAINKLLERLSQPPIS